MEDILAIILIFGGGTAIAISFSPIGRAIAERIRGKGALAEPDSQILAELDDLRAQVGELQERVDFSERLLGQVRGDKVLDGGGEG